MAKVLATVSGTALKPGISRNRRLYSPEAVASAVVKAQKQLAEGSMPLSMRSHHAADDDSTRIVGRITSLTLAEDGSARFTADIADTPHGHTIASLLDTGGGTDPFLSGVSIRGAWDGRVRTVRDAGGELETGDSLTLHGLDYTASPGVPEARIDTFAWAKDGATETTERVLITESVQEARVTITEETAPAPDGALEATAQTAAPPGTTYADPGYLKDGKKRYPLPLGKPETIRAAWSYISQKDNAAQYTANQLKRIKGKIKAAMKKIGATIADEGYVIWPAEQVTESAMPVSEYGGMDGSFSVCASNGPLNISVSSYCIDPADLDLILRAAADAACKAFAAMDPDMDGDIDVPGADAEDTDHDAGESAPTEGQVTETSSPDPASGPAAAAPTSKEGSAVSETTTQEAAPAPVAAPSITLTEAQFGALLARTAPPAVTAEAIKTAEAAAAPVAPAPAAPAAPAVTETADERIARLVEERAAARIAAEVPAAVAETEDQRIERLVEARVTAEKQRLVAEGRAVPGRKGLTSEGAVDEHTATVATAGGEMPPAPPGKSWDEMHKWSTEELGQYATPGLADYVFKGRAGRAV